MTVSRTTRLQVYRWTEDTDAFTRSQMDLSHESIETKAAVFVTGTTLPVASEEHERSFFYKSDDQILYFFNGTDETGEWVALGQYGTVGQMADLAYGDTNASGIVNAVARIDHVHELPEVDLSGYVQKATLTSKGDVYVATSSGVPSNLPVGANDTVLTADATTSTGVAWKAVDLSGLVTKGTVDAKGDLIAGTANNLVTRLAAGSDGQMLTVDASTATGLAWTGGPKMQAYYEKTRSHGTVTSNLSVGDAYNIEVFTLGANISVSLYAGDLAPGDSGLAYNLTLVVTNDGTANRLLTFPPTVQWANGFRPNEDRAANRTNIWSLFTYNGGATWFGFLAGRGFS